MLRKKPFSQTFSRIFLFPMEIVPKSTGQHLKSSVIHLQMNFGTSFPTLSHTPIQSDQVELFPTTHSLFCTSLPGLLLFSSVENFSADSSDSLHSLNDSCLQRAISHPYFSVVFPILLT